MGRTRVALYHHLPPGGAARAMTELVRRTSEDIEHVLFRIAVGDDSAGTSDPLGGLGIETHTVSIRPSGPGRALEWGAFVPRVLAAERRIASLIDKGDHEAVVAHHQRHTHAPSLLTRLDTPSTYFVHEPRRQSFEPELRPRARGTGVRRLVGEAFIRPLDAAVRRLDIRATEAADELMCNSEHTREYIWRAYGRDATVIPLGVDLDRFKPAPQPAPGTGHQGSEVLMVAAIERPKGIDMAVRAVATIDKNHRPTLRIVHNRADPAHQSEIESLATRLNVNLVLERELAEEELVERYRSTSALVLTSRLEPLGLSAMEAAACGTPCVAVREGGYRETIVDGVTGLFADRDPVSLGRAIDRIVGGEATFEPASVRESIAQTRDWSRAIDRYVEVVARTCGR